MAAHRAAYRLGAAMRRLPQASSRAQSRAPRQALAVVVAAPAGAAAVAAVVAVVLATAGAAVGAPPPRGLCRVHRVVSQRPVGLGVSQTKCRLGAQRDMLWCNRLVVTPQG